MDAQGRERDAGWASAENSADDGSGPVKSGPGGLCAEAQADGVPCTELSQDCEACRRAVQGARRPHPEGRQDPLGS